MTVDAVIFWKSEWKFLRVLNPCRRTARQGALTPSSAGVVAVPLGDHPGMALPLRRANRDGQQLLGRFTRAPPTAPCRARFLLRQGGDTAKAIALARESVGTRCSAESARETLGLACYVAWMSSTGAPRDEALRQARVFLPAGPALLDQLATSDGTVEAARQLKASGENIDQRDNRRYTALAHALEHRDPGATERLLRLGARPDALIGHDDMPTALLPVLASDFEGIRVRAALWVPSALTDRHS
jgi:hypothetical protein